MVLSLRARISIRQSLIAVALLGAITCVVSLVALTRLMATTHAQRVERARDAVLEQLQIMRRSDDATSVGGTPAVAIATVLGVRGGVLPPGSESNAIVPALDPAEAALVDEVLARSRSSGASSITQAAVDDKTYVVGARPTARGALAWMVYPVVPPRWMLAWRTIGLTIGLAGLALVVASIQLAVSAQREQSRLARELAEQKHLASLGRVAAGVAHEVRNPLAAIKLRLDLARMDTATPPAILSELAEASTEIARLDRIVADLLIVSGRRTGPRARTDLAELASQRAGVVGPWARERGVAIDVDGRASAAIDADAIGRVIDNLIRNAVEASGDDGAVSVTVSNGDCDARIVVADSGPGIDPARANELFEPFFTTKPDGTGLGLAMSRAIASAHGGTLTYERREGTTQFILELPVSTEASA
jgi:signal transduction histidine kinase